MNSNSMKAALTHQSIAVPPHYQQIQQRLKTSKTSNYETLGPGPNPMKALISEVGDLQKTSDKLMFALVAIRFPSQYDEDL